MALLPPRLSLTTSPFEGTTVTVDENSSLSLVALTKDASPAASYPLSSLNNSVLGVRQRRQSHSFHSGPVHNEVLKGPPRSSLTMSMGSSGGNGLVLSSSTTVKADESGFIPEEHWLLVYGFHTKDQQGEVIRKLKAEGTVTNLKMASGNGNWLALQYDSILAAEKAASVRSFQLSDGCICGVEKLPNYHEFFREQQLRHSTVVACNLNGDRIHESIGLFFRPKNTTNAEQAVGEIKESDILLVNSEKGPREEKGCCEKFMGWVYGW